MVPEGGTESAAGPLMPGGRDEAAGALMLVRTAVGESIRAGD